MTPLPDHLSGPKCEPFFMSRKKKRTRTMKKKKKKRNQPSILASALEPSHITLSLPLSNDMTTERSITALIRRQGKEPALLIRRAFRKALGDTVRFSDKLLVS